MWQSTCHPFLVYVNVWLSPLSLPFSLVVVLELQQADLISSEHCKKLTNISHLVRHQREKKKPPETMIKSAEVLRRHGFEKMSKLLLGRQTCICTSSCICTLLISWMCYAKQWPLVLIHLCGILLIRKSCLFGAHLHTLLHSQTVPVSAVTLPIVCRHRNCRIPWSSSLFANLAMYV